MPTLTPTAVTGARSQPREATFVDPARELPEAEHRAVLDGTGLNGPFIADLLSDVLTHERCGAHLYRSVAGRTKNPILKRRYEDFGEQTTEHVAIVERLISRLGGDPQYVSPTARATEKSDSVLLESSFLLAGSTNLMEQELVMLDVVMLAEAKDHANWSSLAKLTDEVPEGEVRDAFREAVDAVEPQEDEHLGWAQDMRHKLIAAQASSGVMTAMGEKAEEMVARIKSWLS